MAPITIVGTGLAGYSVARELRKLDKATPLRIISRDHGGFYSKPMLSNALASGKSAAQLLMKSAEQMAAELNAQVLAHTRVDAIASDRHILATDRGELAYSKLVLALGADPSNPELQGDGADAVISVNDLDDYQHFRSAIDGKQRVAILGGGLIGCEFANDLAGRGYRVDVIDLAQWPLSRLLPEAGGALLCERLAAVGVHFHAGCSASSVNCTGQGYCLELSNNQRIETDVVLSAIGLRPRIQLAQAAGLAVGRGVVVDGKLQASAADIYALGDCAEVCGQVLPFVMPIMQAARALAATLAGNPTAVRYPAMPVVVKTPACPTTVCPPPPASSGNWHIETPAAGLKALFCDASGKPLGFALLDAANAEKQALTAQMPAWLEAR